MNVYTVSIRHAKDQETVRRFNSSNVRDHLGAAGETWIETHVTIMPTAESARNDVLAKVRRMGQVPCGTAIVRLLAEDVGQPIGYPTRPASSALQSNLTWNERSWQEADGYDDEEDIARQTAIAQTLADIGNPGPGRRRAFENALLSRGFKVVNAKTGR